MDAKALTTTQDYLDKRYLAELVGTLALVLIGCASIGAFSGWLVRAKILDT